MKDTDSTKKNKGRGNRKVSPFDALYMQILRSQGYKLSEISDMVGYSEGTVSNHTADVEIPDVSLPGVSVILRLLIKRTAHDAYVCRDIDEKHRYPLTLQRYVESLKGLEEIAEALEIKNRVLSLEQSEEIARGDGDTELAELLKEKRLQELEKL